MKIILILYSLIFVSTIASSQTTRSTVKINDSVALTLERIPLDTANSEYNISPSFPHSINGKPVFGADGNIPTFVLTKATLKINDQSFILDVSDMYNPWYGTKPYEKLFSIKEDGNHIYFRGLFSDGAGSYGAEWLIIDDSCIRTILTKSEWIMFEYFNDEEK